MRLNKTYLLVLFLLSNASGTSQENPRVEGVYPPLSPIHLISKPEQYHGKRVTLKGYYHAGFEESALYLSKADADYVIAANALWVSVAQGVKLEGIDCSVNDLKYFDGRYVEIVGIFNMNGHGHLGVFSGEVENVDSIRELRQWRDGRRSLVKFDKDNRILSKRKCK